ncbi:endo-1,4-beta-xylanase [Streptomyces griseoaurantiacus]|uniref:endo-1,4-beta-xylanase n=1 Tax=Streptomyces griseoaurantiacus TaxID=68213 RepID=UPI002E2C6704|nr:endo-1,4-beta-xylanase [Streptomyces jietaisiensis]
MNSSRTGLRRAALVVLSAALVATAAGTAQAHPGKAGPAKGHHDDKGHHHGKGHPKPAASLRDLADRRHVLIGTAVDTTALAEDSAYRATTAREFSSVTAENVMKWEVVEPERGRYDFSAADELVRFARAHGQQVRGHTLLWHNQLPAWLTEGVADGSIDAKELRKILREHITAEVTHFKGRIYQWDVVNEVFEEDGSLRDSIWLQQLGPSYIADAFRWAHKADPKAKLFMNDYNVEGVNAKSTAYYELAKKLRAQGVPVQGMGVQAHLDIQYGFPTDLAANLARFDRLGLQTAITEADVRMFTPSDPAKLARQASDYRGLLAACLATKGCASFTVWGFTDKYSWVPGTFEGEGEANILDADFRHKPAYAALREELAKRH